MNVEQAQLPGALLLVCTGKTGAWTEIHPMTHTETDGSNITNLSCLITNLVIILYYMHHYCFLCTCYLHNIYLYAQVHN